MLGPKRDGIYSFLRHLGPFGCITTAIFSGNAILSKTGSEEKIYTLIYTDHQVPFRNGFGFFHKPQCTEGLWKIAKKPHPIVKFGCVNDCANSYFFQKINLHFSKNCKNYKKNIWVTKKLKKTTPWYIYFDLCFVEPIIFFVFNIF